MSSNLENYFNALKNGEMTMKQLLAQVEGLNVSKMSSLNTFSGVSRQTHS